MAEKVAKCGVRRESGFLYFIDKSGNIARAKMARGRKKQGKAKQEVVYKSGIRKADGYLYFVDKQGDISRVKMARR